MNPETIIAELRRINAWRRGDDEISAPAPGYFGDVLDAAADSLASLIASNTTLRRERNAANDLHGTARGANAELADELASVSGRLSGAELERDKLRARVKELDELYRDLSVAYEQNASQCVQLNRELKIDTVEWLNGTAIQRDRAEKAEAHVKELEATCAELVTDGNALTLAANLAKQSQRAEQAEARVKELQKQEAESRRLFYAEQDKRQSAEYRIGELEAALRKIAAQKPEKPDYWTPCGQCDSNIEDAKDALARREVQP